MKKIILILGGALLLLVLYKTVGSSLPEYNPERSYVNLETEILEAFILAKDSATIELSEGHYELNIVGIKGDSDRVERFLIVEINVTKQKELQQIKEAEIEQQKQAAQDFQDKNPGYGDPEKNINPGSGGGKGYDWKGSTTNYAKDDPKMSQSSDNANGLYSSRTSMEHLYNKMVVYGAGQQADATDMIEVFWGHYLGNPNATAGAGAQSPSYGLPIDFSTGTTSAMSIFVTDENGDDLSKFLVDYMDENNLQLVNFEFSLSARLQVQDPVKAATIPYFQAGQFNNATNVTSIPLWTMTQGYMYAFKCATNNHYGHTRGIVMGSMGLSTAYDSTLSQGFNNDGDRFALNTLGSTSNQWSQPNAFLYNNLQENSARINSQLALHIDMNLNNPMAYMQSTDPNFTTPESYFDINDGIVFDMLVHIR